MDNSEYNAWKWLGAENLRPKQSKERKLDNTMRSLEKKLQFEKLDILNLLSDKF